MNQHIVTRDHALYSIGILDTAGITIRFCYFMIVQNELKCKYERYVFAFEVLARC